MKKIFNSISLITLFLGVISCQEKLDENSQKFNNSAYMSTTSTVADIDRKLGGEAEIEPRLASIATRNETITVSIQDFLEEYNKKNATGYRMLPIEEVQLYELENPSNKSTNGTLTVTIKEGKISSKVRVKIKALDSEVYPLGKKYAIPLGIVSSSAKQILSNKETVVTLQRPVVTSVAHVKDGYAPKIVLDKDLPEMPEFTFQVFFMFDEFRAYSGRNYNMSLVSYGWYSRINQKDINLSDTQKEFSVDGVEIKTNTWYQATYVYTKDHRVKIYLNGKHIRTFIRPNVVLKGGATVSIFNPQKSYSVPHILREVRFWNKALTEAQINADLYNPIDADSEGLIVYLPIDSEKRGYQDITKYNNTVEFHEATSTSKYGIQDGTRYHKLVPYEKYGIDKWHNNVIFPAEKLEQVEP